MRVLVWVPPGVPPTPLCFRVRGHVGVRLPVPQKVIQESSRAEAFTVLNCGAGRRSVNAGPADHSASGAIRAAPLMGQAPPAPPSLQTASHKGAQEDANRDEWHFLPGSFYTNQSFSFVMASRQPPPPQPPLGPDNV